MPIVNIAGVGQVRFPDGMSEDDIKRAIERDILPSIRQPAPTEPQEKGSPFVGGALRLGSTIQTGIESLFDAEGAARRGLARSEELAKKYGSATDLEAVKKAYAERGLLPAAGEVVSQVPGAVAEQAPQIATTLASARLGAVAGAPFGPLGAVIGGAAGATLPSLAQLFGANIQRQAEEGQPISRTKAAAAAVPGAALETASTFIPLGGKIVGKILGPQAEQLLARGGSKVVDEGLAKVLTKGAAVGAAFEVPTEVIQQMLERLQAGLSLTSPDALAEYGEAAYGAGLVGGPFGAVGRVGQRYVARGEREKEAADQRRLDAEIAAKEQEAAQAAEKARLTTPEYRQELNDKIYTLKDELAQLEPIAKDKTVDPDVRKEAIDRANEIKKELKDLQTSFKQSMQEAGLTPTLAQEKAKGFRTLPVVDEFGNIVKPKGQPLTEEEYGAKLEAAANQWNQTREKIFELREKEEAAEEAKKEKQAAQVGKQVQSYLRSLDEYDRLIEEADIKARLEKGLPARKKAAEEATFTRAMERIQKAVDNFGFNLLGYESDANVQKLKTQLADLSRPESIAAAPDRNARLQQLDELKVQLNTATQNASRTSGEGMQRLIDEGRITRDVTKALGIEGLGGRTLNAADAVPNIEARIAELEERRKDLTASKKDLLREEATGEASTLSELLSGTVTPSGMKLLKTEVQLRELKRLLEMGRQQETGAEAAVAGTLEGATKKEALAVPVQEGLPGVAYETKIKSANQKAAGAFDNIVSFVDDLNKKRFFGGAPGQVGLASTTEESLRKNIDSAQTQLIDGLLEEIATARVARGLRPLSKTEAISVAMDIDGLVDMLVTRSLAPAPGMITETETTPAQMRGTKIVSGAQEIERDVRGTRELPFGATPQKAQLLSSKGQENIARTFNRLHAAEREISGRIEALDKQMSELQEPPTSPQAQELSTARAEALDSLRAAQAETARYKQELQGAMGSAGLSAKQALQAIKNVIRSIKQDTIAEGQRPVRAERPLLRAQYGAAPTDLIKDLDRVLRMENLQPEVKDTLEQARRRMEEGSFSAELEELVDEQVGRILRGTDRPFVLERDVTQPGGRRARAAAGKAELVDDIKARLRLDSELSQFAAEDRTLVPKGKRFEEVAVQPDLFGETLVTQRASPGQLKRLQRSKAVTAEKEKIAAAKAEEQKIKAEEQRKAREKAAIKAETTPARQVEAQMQAVRDVLSDVMKEYRGEKQAKIAEKNKQMTFLMKSVRTRALKRLDEITNAASKRRYIKDVEEDLAFHFPKEAKLLRYLTNQISDLQKQQTGRLATLDQRVQNEVKFLKTLEKRAAAVAQGTPEQRKAQKQAALVRGQLVKAEQIIKEAKEIAATRESEQAALRKLGLGLPGVSVTAERRELAKGKGVVRRSKVVPILSKREIELRLAERKADLADLDRPLTKPELMDAFKKIERLTSGQRTTQTKLYLEAAADAKRAKTQLDNYLANLRGKEPNKQRIKDLRDEVDETAKIVRELNRRIASEIGATYRGVEEAAIPIRKAITRGPIGGEVKGYDKKFTPDQLNQMANLGVGAFTSTKSYSVDDVTDFRIGEGESGGISLDEANKRMADVEQKVKAAGIKFKYFPTMKDVTVDILKDMERQGVDIYETSIRGGVKPDGTVFVIGENHTDMLDLEKTIAHEFVGHYSFEGMLGPDGMTDLMLKADKAFATKDNENGLEVLAKDLGVYDEYRDAVVSAGRFYEQDLADGKITEREVRRIAKTKGLREIIAYTMEKRVDQNFMQKAKRWIQELVGAARAFFKKIGMLDAAKLSTSDLFYMMKQANQTFEEGKPIAYKKENGDIDFAITKPKYGADMEDLGSIADKVVGSQKGFVDGIKANVMGLAGRVQFVDRWAALEEMVKRGVEKGIIDSLKAADIMYFARMADQRHAFTAEVASNGNLKLKEVKRPDGKIEKIIESERGPSLSDVSAALREANVGDADATGRLFTLYLAAERAANVGLDKLNYSGKVTQADLNKALAMGRANPAFQKARGLYNEYNKGLIEFAVKSGAMSKELGARLMARGDYIPFYRIKNGVAELLIGGEKAIQIGNVKNQPYLQELIGGNEAIADFFTSSLQNTSLLTDMALRNMATYQAANALQDLGVAKIIKVKGDSPAGKDIIHFKYNGDNYVAQIDTQAKKDLFGDIPTELLVTGMEGIKIIVPGIVRGLAGPANILRKFVTRDPRYAVRQVFRDSLTASLTTGSNMKPIVDTMGQIKKMYSEGAGALQRRGVIGGQVITGAPEDMAKIMQQISSGKPGWDLAMAKLDQFAMAGDAATRMALYNSFLKQGLSEREATMATLESMNFGRRGVSPSIYFLNSTIPFFNAGIQGLDVLYRAYTNQMPYAEQLKVKQKMIARGLMLTGFTLAYAAMMQDDEAYKNATPEQRYGNWLIRIPGVKEPFRVPIPFELGLIFKALPEGAFNAAFSDEKGSKVAADLTKQLMRSLPGNPAEVGVPVPTFMKPFIETALNKSFFTGRDIVDARLQGLDKQFQYRDKTPEVLKTLGPVFEMMGLAPVQVENIIRSVTGSLGVGLLSVVDPVLKSGEAGGVAAKGPSEIPLVGGLFQPNDAGRVIDNAYDSVKEIQARQGSYKKLIEEGELDAAQEYLKKNLPDISMASFAGSFRQQMGQITKAERAVKAAPEKVMSPDEKRKQLDDLRKLKIDLSKQFTDVREQIGRQAAR